MRTRKIHGFGILEVSIGMSLVLLASFVAIHFFNNANRQVSEKIKKSDLVNLLEQRLTRMRGVVRSDWGSASDFVRATAADAPSDPLLPAVLANPPLTRDITASAFASGAFGFPNPERGLTLDTMSVDVTYAIELVGQTFNGTTMVPFSITPTSGHRLMDVSLVRVRASARPASSGPNRDLARVYSEREVLIALP